MNNDLLEYNGYFGSVQYSKEDQCLFGKIEFIDDMVLYDGSSVDELRAAFMEAVDSYLQSCAERGVEPDSTCKGSFNVRVGTDLHKRATRAARERQQSLNDFVKEAVESKLSAPLSGGNVKSHEDVVGQFDALLSERLVQSTAFTIATLTNIWKSESPAGDDQFQKIYGTKLSLHTPSTQ
ncbi:type II toxin-antitoxin system HicB family antitoxin [Achromobacter sp. KK8]|jgi:predicted HicB family RNase H-like nuclease